MAAAIIGARQIRQNLVRNGFGCAYVGRQTRGFLLRQMPAFLRPFGEKFLGCLGGCKHLREVVRQRSRPKAVFVARCRKYCRLANALLPRQNSATFWENNLAAQFCSFLVSPSWTGVIGTRLCRPIGTSIGHSW